MSLVKKNIAANFIGNGFTALLALVLIPLYIKFLGVEAWGIIGIFISLQSLSFVLDLGLSATLNREVARLSLHQDKAQEMRDLVRTFELIYWAFAAAIGALVVALAPPIAHRWIHSNELSPDTVKNAIRLMGLAITFSWPFALYSGGLLGLQRQVLLSGINISTASLRGVGSILILWQVSPTLRAFFVWQIVINFLQISLAGWLLWNSLPHTGSRPSFARELLHKRWRFAAGMSGIIVMSLILTQMDKIILSKLLSLEMLGYYILASTVAASLYLLVVPLFYALYPRFTQLVSLDDQQGLKEIYHRGCQLTSVLILPIAVTIVFFSKEILFVWTGDSKTIEYTHLVLSVLIAGTALNGLMYLPHALQFAHGWTRLVFYSHLIAVVAFGPLIILTATSYGAIGAAFIWAMLNSGFVLIGIPLMHRRLLRGEQWRWYLEDVGLPLAVSLGAALFCLTLAPTDGPRLQLLLVLVGVTIFITGATFVATPVTRLALIDYFRLSKKADLQ